jgi:hypothetical protein
LVLPSGISFPLAEVHLQSPVLLLLVCSGNALITRGTPSPQRLSLWFSAFLSALGISALVYSFFMVAALVRESRFHLQRVCGTGISTRKANVAAKPTCACQPLTVDEAQTLPHPSSLFSVYFCASVVQYSQAFTTEPQRPQGFKTEAAMNTLLLTRKALSQNEYAQPKLIKGAMSADEHSRLR